MTHFLSCDWGTTAFRLRLVEGETGRVLAQRRQASGAKALFEKCAPGDAAGRERVFSDFLRGEVLELLTEQAGAAHAVPVVVSGMASSSVGWRELPYARVPIFLDGTGLVQEQFELPLDQQRRACVHLVSGVRDESDIMRGEEVEIIGLFAGDCYSAIAESGCVILPGTHSKHIRLERRQITGFDTYMTGELFEVLGTHSLLKASVQSGAGTPAADLNNPTGRESFIAGVRSASSRGLAESLFQTRVRTVLHGVNAAVNRWFLSGVLIGAELCGLARKKPQCPILLAAPEALSGAYQLAFETLDLGGALTVVPPPELAVALVRGHGRLLRCSP
jgi:2-dehydro-3-deoxygalactonokinase